MSQFRTLSVSDPKFETDNLRLITLKSNALKHRANISVFVPETEVHLEKLPLVILLHGVYGSHWSWTHQGGVHLTAQKMISAGGIKPMIIAMPSDGLWGDGSGYLPHSSQDFERWIVDDVPAAVAEALEIDIPETQFIAGLSMGGYGALRLGSLYPDQFTGMAALSALTDFRQMENYIEEPLSDIPDVKYPDLASLMIHLKGTLPPFQFDCGKDDPQFTANLDLNEKLTVENVDHQFFKYEGAHNWVYWSENIKNTLRFFDKLI